MSVFSFVFMYWYVILKRKFAVNNALVSIIYDFSADNQTDMEYERLKARTSLVEKFTWKCHSTSRHKSSIFDKFFINFFSVRSYCVENFISFPGTLLIVLLLIFYLFSFSKRNELYYLKIRNKILGFIIKPIKTNIRKGK